MHTKLSKILSKAMQFIELFIALILLIRVLLGVVGLIGSMGIFHGDPFGYTGFSDFLASVFSLVIGIEFVRMLVKHTASSVVEVLLFAIARQLIVEHTSPVENLIGIVAIAGVFAIRKFLFVGNFNPSDLFIFNAAKPIAQVNRIARTDLPGGSGKTIGELMEEELVSRKRPLEEGAKITIGKTSMRIATLTGGQIETIDVFSRSIELAEGDAS